MVNLFNNVIEIGSYIANLLASLGDFFLTSTSSFLDISQGWSFSFTSYLGDVVTLHLVNGDVFYTLIHPVISFLQVLCQGFGITNPSIGVSLLVGTVFVFLVVFLVKMLSVLFA